MSEKDTCTGGSERCVFCPHERETEIIAIDPAEVMDLPLGEEAPKRSIPVCRSCARIVRGCPTVEEEPWPDWSEIDYPTREVFP